VLGRIQRHAGRLRYVSVLVIVDSVSDILVMARSRIKASESSALKMSLTTFTLAYSRPMTGVLSTCSNRSSAPESDSGSRACLGWSSACRVTAAGGTVVVVVVVDIVADDTAAQTRPIVV
jgi:hypothetical protein